MASCNRLVIETHDLVKSYEKKPVLDKLNLKVEEHSIFGFLGPNGAGKTTTIKLLLGLSRPTSGSATVFGLDVGKQGEEIRSRVGYLPQEPRFFDYLSAREILRYTARFFFSGPGSAIEERVQEMLELVGLDDKADRPMGKFSGGEKQRLGIAQAEVNYPDLLILDEPAANLDPIGRRDVLEVMCRLRKHTTVFYSTHILDDVQRVSDAVAILNNGRLVAQGSIEDLLAGGEGVSYEVHLKGEIEEARRQVLSLPWVTRIADGPHNGSCNWLVTVSDPPRAEQELFKRLAYAPVVVTEFRRRQYELEDVFMQMVGEA